MRNRMRPSVWARRFHAGRCVALLIAVWLAVWPGDASAKTATRIERLQLFLIPAPVAHTVRVMEALRVTAGGRVDDTFTLPEGAEDVTVDAPPGLGATVRNLAVQVSGTAPDATMDLTITYRLPMPGAARTVPWHADAPVDEALVYVPEGQVSLAAQGVLTSTRTVDISGTTFRVFTRLGIREGEDWPLSLQWMPAPTDAPAPAGVKVIGLHHQDGAGALQAVSNLILAAFVLTVGLISIRRSGEGRAKEPRDAEASVWSAWMRLERAYEQGQVDEPTYRRRREALKRRILALRGQSPTGRA
ncbi:hypothetical protein [Alicyclobacillus sp.]|uniref:hypothetical protein n=1 Tax=Alicyclobacillus sp. TaxID=61169 RepID=UPI0025BFA1C2|nr:hypothetical protein [Alicyclobacillus sp.]MCL6515808.1 hypothetical protein [Alicyclobacillus sp.]